MYAQVGTAWINHKHRQQTFLQHWAESSTNLKQNKNKYSFVDFLEFRFMNQFA